LARAGGLRLTSQKSKCLRIFIIISESSIKDNILIDPEHLGQRSFNKAVVQPALSLVVRQILWSQPYGR
jgi:hypothetical protein